MRIRFKDEKGINCLRDRIPKSVHNELSRVYEGRQLSEKLRTIVNPGVPMRTGNLRFSPTVGRLMSPVVKSGGMHRDVLTYEAVGNNNESYAYKMEVEEFKHYTTPGTGSHYMQKGMNIFVEGNIPKIMTVDAVRKGVSKGGMN